MAPPDADTDSTVSDTSDQSEPESEQTVVNISDVQVVVDWPAENGEKRTADGLALHLYFDASSNQAFLKLKATVHLKHQLTRSKQSIFLFIYPERIDTMVLVDDTHPSAIARTRLGAGIYSLQFRMGQTPEMVIPKDVILSPKPASQSVLDSVKALSRATLFTICLRSSVLPKASLLRLCKAFSGSHSRPRTDIRRSDLGSLYGGKGGEVVEISNNLSEPAADSPPSYDELAHTPPSPKQRADQVMTRPPAKRRRYPSAEVRDNTSKDMHSTTLMNDMLLARLVQHIDQRFDQLTNRLESRMDGIENRLGQLETRMQVMSQSSSEQSDQLRDEVDGMVARPELDDFREEVCERIENEMYDAQFKLEDYIKDTIEESIGNIEANVVGRLGRASVALVFESDV